jgi:hypothetical protein
MRAVTVPKSGDFKEPGNDQAVHFSLQVRVVGTPNILQDDAVESHQAPNRAEDVGEVGECMQPLCR